MEAIVPVGRHRVRNAAGADDEATFLRDYLEAAVVRLQVLAERLEQPGVDPHGVAGALSALAQELWQATDPEVAGDAGNSGDADPSHPAIRPAA